MVESAGARGTLTVFGLTANISALLPEAARHCVGLRPRHNLLEVCEKVGSAHACRPGSLWELVL